MVKYHILSQPLLFAIQKRVASRSTSAASEKKDHACGFLLSHLGKRQSFTFLV